MTMQGLKYPQEEFERRGQVWYETRVRSQVDVHHQGEIVAIDLLAAGISKENIVLAFHPIEVREFTGFAIGRIENSIRSPTM